MSYTVIIEPGEDGFLVAHCPEIPGCHSQGATYEEAIANIKESIKARLEVKESLRITNPAEAREWYGPG